MTVMRNALTYLAMAALSALGVAGFLLAEKLRLVEHLTRCEAELWPLEEMPGHPERVRPTGDPIADKRFGDLAVELLNGGLAEVAEELGWLR